MEGETLESLFIASSPYLPIYLFSDSSMYSGHWVKMKVLDGNPISFSFPVDGLTVIDVQGQFKVRERLSERSNKLFDVGRYIEVFLNVTS